MDRDQEFARSRRQPPDPVPAGIVEVPEGHPAATRRTRHFHLRPQDEQCGSEVAREGRVAALLLGHDVAAVPLRFEAEAEARSPEVALVEEEAPGLHEQVPPHRRARANERRRDLAERVRERRVGAEKAGVPLQVREPLHRADSSERVPHEVRDRVERDHVGLQVDVHLVVRQEVRAARQVVELSRPPLGEADRLVDARRPVELERLEMHALTFPSRLGPRRVAGRSPSRPCRG